MIRAEHGATAASAGFAMHATQSSLRLAISCGMALLISLSAGSAPAQSLRCDGQLAGTGDSKSTVLQKCGQPIHVQSVCVGSQGVPQAMIVAGADGVLRQMVVPQCTPMEDWTFFRGTGQFMAVVRFRSDVVESVRDGARAP